MSEVLAWKFLGNITMNYEHRFRQRMTFLTSYANVIGIVFCTYIVTII